MSARDLNTLVELDLKSIEVCLNGMEQETQNGVTGAARELRAGVTVHPAAKTALQNNQNNSSRMFKPKPTASDASGEVLDKDKPAEIACC